MKPKQLIVSVYIKDRPQPFLVTSPLSTRATAEECVTEVTESEFYDALKGAFNKDTDRLSLNQKGKEYLFRASDIQLIETKVE